MIEEDDHSLSSSIFSSPSPLPLHCPYDDDDDEEEDEGLRIISPPL